MINTLASILRVWLTIFSVVAGIVAVGLCLLFLWFASLFLFVVFKTFLGSDTLAWVALIVFYVCAASTGLLEAMPQIIRGPKIKKRS